VVNTVNVTAVSPRGRIRLLGLLTGFVLVSAALELTSFVLIYIITGRPFSYGRIAKEQAGEIEASSPGPTAEPTPRPAVAPPPPEQMVQGNLDATPVELVPHPFLGFVYNPEFPELKEQQGRGAMALTELGFFDLPQQSGQRSPLSVAIFGGSVAAYFSVEGREALERSLSQVPAWRGRPLRVDCFALGGFKQPQMVSALVYLLALGHRFDEIVELDGFNEVAISDQNYRQTGMFPAFPRGWDVLVRQAPDLEQQRRIGKVAYLQHWRATVARWFSRRPLSWSVTSALVWKSLNRWLGTRIALAREDLATATQAGGGYRERGPLRRYASEQELLSDVAAIWGQSSLQMHRLSTAAGAHYHHFLQPNQYVPGSKPMGGAEKAVAYRPDHPYRPPVEQGYPLLQAEGGMLKAQGVDFHDLTGLFASVNEQVYRDDCCHLNGRGTTLLAEAVGRALADGRR
jgi:hypothetical protein